MKRDPSQRQTLAALLKYVGRNRLYLALSLFFAALSVLSSLYVPIVTGRIIDLLVGAGRVDFAAVAPKLGLIAALIAVTVTSQWLGGLCGNRLAFVTMRDIRRDAFRRIQKLPLSYLDAHPTGDVLSRVIADVERLSDGLLTGFTQLFSGVLTIAVTLVMMFSVNAITAAAVVVLTPLSLVAASFIARRTFDMFAVQAKTRGEQTALIDEMVGGQKVVRAFGVERAVGARFDDVNDRLQKASLRAVFFSSLTNPCTRFVNALVYACVGVVGALLCITGGALTIGQLSACLAYANQYAKPFNEISGVVTELQSALASAKRVLELIAEPEETPDQQPPVALTDPDGTVRLEDVSFSYTSQRPLIQHLNLDVRGAQRVAIVGPTGCGKTTLINLLMRFYDVDGGRITVGGQPVTRVTRQSLRACYGMVLQDTWLKAGTIRDNIALARPDATDEEIMEAARAAHAHSFIQRLPDGYQTVVSDDGGSLSQGQRQLLSIARVMLVLPPMLILDEATSSIDTRTEKRIQLAFEKLMRGRTSFIVAHRLSTIQSADVILVMNDGAVVEKGTHDELIGKNGFYAKLYQSQFAG